MMKEKKISLVLYIVLVIGTFFVWSSFQTVRGENIFTDSDQDGLSNEEERLYKTDPQKRDTDGDSYSDGVEVKSGYDPLKPAPGDKLFVAAEDISRAGEQASANGTGKENLTNSLSHEIASVITESGASGEDVKLEDVDARIQELLSGKGSEVVLPPIDVKGLKIKNPIPTDLPEEERKAKEKDQTVKYLTSMAYIFANNSPQKFSSETELGTSLDTLSTQVMGAFSSGNTEMIHVLAENGRHTLEEARDVEVPQSMLSFHIKALQLSQYAISLEDDVKTNTGDPLRDISSMMKIQSLLAASVSYIAELQQKMQEYGITDLPVSL
jgi:hypothetical protein